jgi:hypothetical protein
MHATGKFGSAWPPKGARLLTPGAFRQIVVASRVPAILLVTLDMGRILSAGSMAVAPQALLLACYLIWTRADILLLRKD